MYLDLTIYFLSLSEETKLIIIQLSIIIMEFISFLWLKKINKDI